LAVETPASLSRLLSQHERIDFEWEREELIVEIGAMPGIASVVRVDTFNRYRIELLEDTAAPRVLDRLVRSGVTSIRTSRPTLEEVYLRLIGGTRGKKW
jgi:ABC-2 type transport system ATP-binding protein